jgi:hypothetical protein
MKEACDLRLDSALTPCCCEGTLLCSEIPNAREVFQEEREIPSEIYGAASVQNGFV